MPRYRNEADTDGYYKSIFLCLLYKIVHFEAPIYNISTLKVIGKHDISAPYHLLTNR